MTLFVGKMAVLMTSKLGQQVNAAQACAAIQKLLEKRQADVTTDLGQVPRGYILV
jgi:hypothetical protein